MVVDTLDAGTMTPQHRATMTRRLLVKGVVRVQCENPDDHNKEPYARFYWNMETVLEPIGFRPSAKLVGKEHVVTLVPLDTTLDAILDHLERLGR